MADTQQGVRQRSARNISGNAGTYDEDLRARFQSVVTVPSGSTFNEAMILWLRAVTGSDADNINDLAARYAAQQTDVYNWSSSPQGGEAVIMRWYPDDAATLPDTAAFSRAFIAQVLTTTDGSTNWYQQANSGELRLDGMRRVENLAPTGTVSDYSFITGVTLGGANEIIFPGVSTAEIADIAGLGTFTEGTVIGYRLKMRTVSGSGTIRLEVTGSNEGDITVSIDTTERTYYVIGTMASTVAGVPRIRNRDLFAGTVEITEIVMEFAQNGNATFPPPWVDPTVEYLNIGVNGVRYFNTTNGNSVDGSGVVTEAAGTTITGGAFLREPEATNQILESSDIADAAWTKTNLSAGTQNVEDIGLAGNTLDAGVAAGVAHTATAVVSSSATRTMYAIAKAGTGQYLTIRTSTTADEYAVFDLSGGTVTETGAGATSRITDLTGGWYKCEVSSTVGTGTTGLIGISDTGTPGQADPTFNGANETILVHHVQYENTAFSTSTIITSGSTVTRVADSLTDTSWPSEASALVDVTVNDPIPGSGDEMVMLGFGAGASNVFTIDAATTVSLNVGSIAASATASSSYEGERHQFGMSIRQDQGIVVDDEDNDDTSLPGGSLGDIYIGSASDLTGVPCRLHKVLILDSTQTVAELKQGL